MAAAKCSFGFDKVFVGEVSLKKKKIEKQEMQIR